MEAILWSIRKPYTDYIIIGKKTIEVRKHIPKRLTPCSVNLIYETKANGGCGKVIGEFKCSKVEEIKMPANISKDFMQASCLNGNEIIKYLGDDFYKNFYGLHITDLKIYDKPKELSEFRCVGQCCQWDKIEIKENVFGDYVDNCYDNSFCKTCCKYYNHDFGQCDKPYSHFLTRPPQSYCYVEI